MDPKLEVYSLIIDTNILIDIPEDIQEINWGIKTGTIYIVDSVIDELHQLSKKNGYPVLARNAQQAHDKLTRFLPEALKEGFLLPDDNRLIIARVPKKVPPPLDKTNVDHQQIAFAIALLTKNPANFCAIVTRDREMADIAHAAHPDLQVINPGTVNPLPAIKKQVERQIDWRKRILVEDLNKKTSKSVKRKQETSPAEQPVSQVIIEKNVRNLYARIRAAHHQAILSIMPLELRIALSAHIVPILTKAKQRVVFLFVIDEQAALWWKQELEQRCRLPAGSIVFFGSETITRVGPIRLVIYRHDQNQRDVWFTM